jgi:hypothetical protein
MKLIESKVEGYIRKHLTEKGWVIKEPKKRRGEHGVDIYATHPSWRKSYRIEIKGEGLSHQA